MSDFEARLRRALGELGHGYTPEPQLAERIVRRTRQRARRRHVSAVAAFVTAMVVVFGTVAGMELTSHSPQHARVDGAAAGTTSPDGDGGGAGSSKSGSGHHRSRTRKHGANQSGDGDGATTAGSAGTRATDGTIAGTGGSGTTSSGPSNSKRGDGTSSSSVTSADTTVTSVPQSSDTTVPPTTDTTPSSIATTSPTTVALPPPPPAPPQVSITGPPCPAIGTATYTATVDVPATLTWSDGETGPTATYTFATDGMVTVSVTAKDGSGQFSSTSYPVTVGATC